MIKEDAKKILILHGWLHSATRYTKLKDKLEENLNCEVLLYEFPGFGETEACYYKNILRHYSIEFEKYIRKTKPDIIIAHSMGGMLHCMR